MSNVHPQLIGTGRRREDGPTWKYIGMSTLAGMTFLLVGVFTFSFSTVMELQKQVVVLTQRLEVINTRFASFEASFQELKQDIRSLK